MRCLVCGAADAACVGPTTAASAAAQPDAPVTQEVATPKSEPQTDDKQQAHAPTRARTASADRAVRKSAVADRARAPHADKA